MDENVIVRGPKFNCEPLKGSIGTFIMDCIKNKANWNKIVQIDAEANKTLTYKELWSKCNQGAFNYFSRGYKVGDKLLLFVENNINTLIPYFSAMCAGITICPISAEQSDVDIKNVIQVVEPDFAICDSKLKKRLNDILQSIDVNLNNIIDTEDFVTNLKSNSDEEFRLDDNFDSKASIVLILCSSGTTGPSKGITVRHQDFFYSLNIMMDFIRENDVILHYSPIFWVSSTFFNSLSVIKGGTLIASNKYSIEKTLKLIELHKVTYAFLYTSRIFEMLNYPDYKKYDISSLNTIITGGTPTTREQFHELRGRLPKSIFLYNCYGSTEMMISVGLFDREKDKQIAIEKVNSVGFIAPSLSLKVIDIFSKTPVERNHYGELCIKGPTITKGYYRNSKATAEVIDSEGWYHTGDLSRIDMDGCLFVIGRIKDILIYKNQMVSVTNLEHIIKLHESVQDCAIVGIDSPDGQIPFAFVVKISENKIVEENDIIAYVDEQVNDFEKLRGGVKFVEYIPKTASGKIKKNELIKLI